MLSEHEARQRLTRYFQQLTKKGVEEVEQVVEQFRWQCLEAETFIVRQGELSSQIGYVAAGIFRLFYIDKEGRERTKAFCLESHMVGAYSAILLNEKSNFNIRAEQPSAVLGIPFQTLLSICNSDTSWQMLHLKILQELYVRLERRESELLLDDATTRYLKFLEQYPGLEGQVKQYHIASYLGITPVALSRIRAQLKALT